MPGHPETLIDTVGYFFLLPNFCFMHFPVVDYRTLQRGYFADDVHAIQRRGSADDVPRDRSICSATG